MKPELQQAWKHVKAELKDIKENTPFSHPNTKLKEVIQMENTNETYTDEVIEAAELSNPLAMDTSAFDMNFSMDFDIGL